MIVLQPITPLNVEMFKTVRLRALQDSPHAFGSTYAREVCFTDADWLRRVDRWNGEKGIGFLAMEHDACCGIAGSFLDENDPDKAFLISMWTAPEYRRRGTGRLLVEAVLRWVRDRNAHVLHLMVTSNNQAAIRFYERLGFARTGRTEPYPNDPGVVEYEMAREI